MKRDRARESCFTATVVSMRETGKTTVNTARVLNVIRIARPMKVALLTTDPKVWGPIPGPTVKCTKVNGSMD